MPRFVRILKINGEENPMVSLCSVGCIIALKVFLSDYSKCIKLIFAVLIFVFTVAVMIIMLLNTANYVNCRKEMTTKWKTIKNATFEKSNVINVMPTISLL